MFLVGCGSDSKIHGTVVGKSFTPSNTSVSPVFTGKHFGVAINSTPAEYDAIVRLDGGTIVACRVSAETWASIDKGSSFEVSTNSIWGMEGCE